VGAEQNQPNHHQSPGKQTRRGPKAQRRHIQKVLAYITPEPMSRNRCGAKDQGRRTRCARQRKGRVLTARNTYKKSWNVAAIIPKIVRVTCKQSKYMEAGLGRTRLESTAATRAPRHCQGLCAPRAAPTRLIFTTHVCWCDVDRIVTAYWQH